MSATDTLTAPAAAGPEGTPVEGSNGLLLEVDGHLVPNYAATIVSFEEGDVVSGKVVRIDKDEVLVDIGYKSEGVSPPASYRSASRSTLPKRSNWARVSTLSFSPRKRRGAPNPLQEAGRFEKAWRRIEAAAESGEPVEGSVIEVVKGGLILDLGARGFLPASLVDIRRVHNLDEFMGQTLECKVIELNRSRNNVVLSRRAVLEEERKEVREQILGRLAPGQVVEGKISNIVDFGAFVDLDGIDGLIHISSFPGVTSTTRRRLSRSAIRCGSKSSTSTAIASASRSASSRRRRTPGSASVSTHRPGDVLEGVVTKVVAFGAFVEILPGVEGLVHISELADHHVENPSEVVKPGATLNVKILEIDEERRRLSLSIKRVEDQNMPMGDLGDQIEAAGQAAEEPEGSAEAVEALEGPAPAPPADGEVEAPAEVPVTETEPAEAQEPAEPEPAPEAEMPPAEDSSTP